MNSRKMSGKLCLEFVFHRENTAGVFLGQTRSQNQYNAQDFQMRAVIWAEHAGGRSIPMFTAHRYQCCLLSSKELEFSRNCPAVFTCAHWEHFPDIYSGAGRRSCNWLGVIQENVQKSVTVWSRFRLNKVCPIFTSGQWCLHKVFWSRRNGSTVYCCFFGGSTLSNSAMVCWPSGL